MARRFPAGPTIRGACLTATTDNPSSSSPGDPHTGIGFSHLQVDAAATQFSAHYVLVARVIRSINCGLTG